MAMLFFLCLLMSLLHLDPLQACRSGRQNECDRTPFVPGHNLVGEGFDIVTLEHKGAYVTDMLTYLRPNNTCILCSNQLMENQAQKLPLTVLDWKPSISCSQSLSSFSSDSVSSLLASSSSSSIENDWKLGLNLGRRLNLQLAGSKSDVFKFASARQNEDKTTFASHQFTCTHYSYRVPWNPPLSPEFLQNVKSLPQIYSNVTAYQYQNFINTYGTHFIHQVNLGGTFKRVTSIRTCLATLNHQISASQVKDCLSVGLSVGLGRIDASSLNDSCKKVLNNQDSIAGYSQGFLSHITEVSGGDAWPGVFSMTQNDSAGFHSWLRSTMRKPGLVSYQIRPLHDLVNNSVVSRHLQREIRAYIEKNGLPVETEPRKCCNPYLSTDCCPLQLHRGQLTVTVIRAWALNIDIFGPKEIHVRVIYGGSEQRTLVIKSYDPTWNAQFNYGHVYTGQDLRIQTWYRTWYNHKMLGECVVQIQQGNHENVCWMNKGVFKYSYNLRCDPHLTGPKCDIYSSSP